MKSQLLSVRNVHHIEESQLEQMLTRHGGRVHDHVSFLVSPPCFATNFMSMANFELTSTADEAQGSTSRTVAGEKGAGSGFHLQPESISEAPGRSTAQQERGISCSAPDFKSFDSPSSQERRPLFQPIEGGFADSYCDSSDANPRKVPDAVNENGRGESIDFSILHRPHIVRKKEEVHVELCHKCERMASGHCECGLPVCTAHRYSSDGERNPYGMCGKCQREITGDVEIFNSCGRQV